MEQRTTYMRARENECMHGKYGRVGLKSIVPDVSAERKEWSEVDGTGTSISL
jgi:hypothetical protein